MLDNYETELKKQVSKLLNSIYVQRDAKAVMQMYSHEHAALKGMTSRKRLKGHEEITHWLEEILPYLPIYSVENQDFEIMRMSEHEYAVWGEMILAREGRSQRHTVTMLWRKREAWELCTLTVSAPELLEKDFGQMIGREVYNSYQHLDEKYHENRLKIIEGIVSVKKVLDLAKSYDVSLTVYLASVLIKSIGDAMDVKDWGKDIAIAIPVNLRNYYPSYTVRNFFNAVNVRYNYNGEDLVDIIKEIDKQLKVSLSKENIRNKMNSMARLEDIFVIRLIPIFIKDFILKYAYKFSDFSETMTLSNVGVINMPDAYQSYIDYFSVFMSTSRIQLCLCSYLDNLVFSFTSQFVNSEIEKNFFRFFTSQGINVIINTNDLEGANNNA